MQPVVDTELALPEELRNILPATTDNYQNWDLVEITQNYFRMLLHYLLECNKYLLDIEILVLKVSFVFLIGDGGILIHCISGWDRTPLFISLLRLSLWAVRVISSIMVSIAPYTSSKTFFAGWQSTLVSHFCWDSLLYPSLWLAGLWVSKYWLEVTCHCTLPKYCL